MSVFKILSIDGGGIKGLYSATVLKHLEEEFGAPLADYFDMICGTSTGGLIALALSIKTPAAEIAKFYATKGTEIFPGSRSCWNSIKQYVWGGKYSPKTLSKNILEIVGDKVMQDAKTLLCIPAFNVSKGEPTIFKYPHSEGNFSRDGSIKMHDVALATAAAPTYFPIHSIAQIGELIDGGVWANNPTLCGFIEAVNYFTNTQLKAPNESVKFDTVEILSLSTIKTPAGKPKSKPNKSVLDWGADLIAPSFIGQDFLVNHFLKNTLSKLLPNSKYVRIENDPLSSEQTKLIGLDSVSTESLRLLQHLGEDTGYTYRASKRSEIESFFAEQKKYIIP